MTIGNEVLTRAFHVIKAAIMPEAWFLIISEFLDPYPASKMSFEVYTAFYQKYKSTYKNPDHALHLFCGKSDKWILEKPRASVFTHLKTLENLKAKIE